MFKKKTMNVKKVAKRISKHYKNLGLKKISVKPNSITLGGNITLKKHFDDDMYVEIFIGTIFGISIIFDRIDRTPANYELINKFNDAAFLYKAYIADRNGKSFLAVEANSLGHPKEKDQINAIIDYFEDLLSDDVMKNLKPLTSVTYN